MTPSITDRPRSLFLTQSLDQFKVVIRQIAVLIIVPPADQYGFSVKLIIPKLRANFVQCENRNAY